ncbi:hypothetical protein MTsN2n6_39210 [Vibrio fortis]
MKKSPRIEVKKVGNMMMLKVSKSTISTQIHIGNSVSMTYSSLLDNSFHR